MSCKFTYLNDKKKILMTPDGRFISMSKFTGFKRYDYNNEIDIQLGNEYQEHFYGPNKECKTVDEFMTAFKKGASSSKRIFPF